jgi:hypothetical protein
MVLIMLVLLVDVLTCLSLLPLMQDYVFCSELNHLDGF